MSLSVNGIGGSKTNPYGTEMTVRASENIKKNDYVTLDMQALQFSKTILNSYQMSHDTPYGTVQLNDTTHLVIRSQDRTLEIKACIINSEGEIMQGEWTVIDAENVNSFYPSLGMCRFLKIDNNKFAVIANINTATATERVYILTVDELGVFTKLSDQIYESCFTKFPYYQDWVEVQRDSGYIYGFVVYVQEDNAFYGVGFKMDLSDYTFTFGVPTDLLTSSVSSGYNQNMYYKNHIYIREYKKDMLRRFIYNQADKTFVRGEVKLTQLDVYSLDYQKAYRINEDGSEWIWFYAANKYYCYKKFKINDDGITMEYSRSFAPSPQKNVVDGKQTQFQIYYSGFLTGKMLCIVSTFCDTALYYATAGEMILTVLDVDTGNIISESLLQEGIGNTAINNDFFLYVYPPISLDNIRLLQRGGSMYIFSMPKTLPVVKGRERRLGVAMKNAEAGSELSALII